MYICERRRGAARRPWLGFMTRGSRLIASSPPSWPAARHRSSTRRQLGGCVLDWPQHWPLAPEWRTQRVTRAVDAATEQIVDGKHRVSRSLTYLANPSLHATSNVCSSVSQILNQSFVVSRSVGVTHSSYSRCSLSNNNLYRHNSVTAAFCCLRFNWLCIYMIKWNSESWNAIGF